MWDGIYIADATATLNIIGGSVIQQAKNAVVSDNGGVYFIEGSTLQNNYKDMVVNGYGTAHTGVVRGTTFTQSAAFLPALPALPFGHTATVCAIEITNNAGITIGDPALSAYQNNFTNILVGIRSKNSITTVYNCRFANFAPTAIQQFNVQDAGTAIVGVGSRNYYYQPHLTVGGGNLRRCIFVNVRIGIDVREVMHVTAEKNNLSDIRVYGIRIQRTGSRTINISDNRITNQAVTYAFNTAILLLECYNGTANIHSNFILQTGSIASNYAAQTGVGIRVALATPGDMNLNIVDNRTISRVKTGIWVQNLTGKYKVFITNNAVSFTKPNAGYTFVHTGIKVQNCATVKVSNNEVMKGSGNPVVAMRDNLRGVSMENSTTTTIAHNYFTRMGSGVYGWELCTGSAVVCDTFLTCYDGVFLTGGPATGGACDIGDQVVDYNNGNSPAPTGCEWANCIYSDIDGRIQPAIWWYRDAAYTPNTSLVGGSMYPTLLNTTTLSTNPSACDLPQYFSPQAPEIERAQNAEQAVFNPGAYTSGTEQGYQGRRSAHRMLKATPTWMTLGTLDDSLYTAFYLANDQENIGLFRNFEDMAAIDSVNEAGSILSSIADTNVSEYNLKVVYSIYLKTWMQGVYGFSPADSVTLYGIAMQYASDAGEAVYSARVLLGLDVNETGTTGTANRLSNLTGMQSDSTAAVSMFPNPASNQLNVNTVLPEGQSGTIVILDLQGKTVLQQSVVNSGTSAVSVAELDNGLYFVLVYINGVLIETNKLEVIHE
jgi:hypothetical protein